MDKRVRLALSLLLLGLVVFLGLLFLPWVEARLLRPAAQAVWLFLRLFVLSVDQVFFWRVLLLTGAAWVLYRLTRREQRRLPAVIPPRSEALGSIQEWQSALASSREAGSPRGVTRQKLLFLVTNYYDAQQLDSNPNEIRQAIQQGRLPLPDSVYRYLFPPQPADSSRLLPAARRWYRRITRREAAEFQQMIDELIRFLDS